ncbi:NUDIX hydrolase [Shimia abyssi]|uniref:8-oxo-dGTP pyrophosphatase MutT (NUDIX family) n=1 Tax=Shimia abyssi TaxID=1662395 RepID=A0A2P8F5Y9_9RHOB|nr:NUDIX hydrolase [Shimia abyssi]PSL17131.1 8-oxo-dGTP pyrophosphatase MutT (NUDIX family) [Shimia abyssi]
MGLQHPADIAAMIKAAGKKNGKHLQYGAVPFRIVDGKTQVLLITSRRTHRWIVPKGWPITALKPHKAAATEAWEEAGVRGTASKHCIGVYSYPKLRKNGRTKICTVLLFPIEVRKLANSFPERGQRKRKWLRPKRAAARIENTELAKIIRRFDAQLLR